MLKIILSVIFILICVALTVVVLLQEGKSAGLGAISGMADTYWGKNKGRSMEGNLQKFTTFAAAGSVTRMDAEKISCDGNPSDQ